MDTMPGVWPWSGKHGVHCDCVHIRQLKLRNERVLYFFIRTHVQNAFGKITNAIARTYATWTVQTSHEAYESAAFCWRTVGAAKPDNRQASSNHVGVQTCPVRLRSVPDDLLAAERNLTAGARSTSSGELRPQCSRSQRSLVPQVLPAQFLQNGEFYLHPQPVWESSVRVRQRQHQLDVHKRHACCLLRTDSQRYICFILEILYTSFIHHKGRSNNETNKQAEKKRKT